MKQVTIRFAKAAEVCLSDIESFKSLSLGVDAAAKFVDSFLDNIVKHLKEDPLRYRQNAQLVELGLDVREYLDTNGYRTLYGIDGCFIDVWLILHTRQDIEKALWRHMMFR